MLIATVSACASACSPCSEVLCVAAKTLPSAAASTAPTGTSSSAYARAPLSTPASYNIRRLSPQNLSAAACRALLHCRRPYPAVNRTLSLPPCRARLYSSAGFPPLYTGFRQMSNKKHLPFKHHLFKHPLLKHPLLKHPFFNRLLFPPAPPSPKRTSKRKKAPVPQGSPHRISASSSICLSFYAAPAAVSAVSSVSP